MEDISASHEDVRAVMDDLLERDIAQQKRKELSDESFKEWVYNTLYLIFAKLGYRLQAFEDFWRDIGISISSGWRAGREQARAEAEVRRKIRERKRRDQY